MATLIQLKQAVCEALERKQFVTDASSLRIDLKLNDDGTLRKVVLFTEHEFTVRGGRKAGIERYEMNS